MKKLFIILSILSFTVLILASDAVNITFGAENLLELKKAKPVYIFVTFDNFMWGSTPIEKKKAEYEAKGKEFDLDTMKSEFFRIMNKNINVGKKWGFKQINNLDEAKKGFLFVLNFNKQIPAGQIAKGYAKLTIYKSEDKENPIIEGEMASTYIAKMPWDMSPKKQFSNMGELFVKDLAKFMKKQVK